MSDLFHENVPDAWIDRILGIVWAAQYHTFQCLTKRAERLHAYMRGQPQERIARAAYAFFAQREPAKARLVPLQDFLDDLLTGWPLSNLWLGVSVEHQATADARIPWLLRTLAAVRFVSYEPALGSVDFTRIKWNGPGRINSLTGRFQDDAGRPDDSATQGLDWVIAGGESGPRARPCNLEWLRQVVAQCGEANVACFVKQVGARPCIDTTGGARFDDHTCYKVRDAKGGDPAEWPDELRVQQWPFGHDTQPGGPLRC
jgi:protein gp37